MGAREGGTAVKFGISLVPATEQLDRIRDVESAIASGEVLGTPPCSSTESFTAAATTRLPC
jgi:hypothetical protein